MRLNSINPENFDDVMYNIAKKYGLDKDLDFQRIKLQKMNQSIGSTSVFKPSVPKLMSLPDNIDSNTYISFPDISNINTDKTIADIVKPINSQLKQKIRKQNKIDSAVWHRTAGSKLNLDRVKKTGIGTHYWIKKDGTIVQTVDTPLRVAWHTGKTDTPNVKNANTIGIEVVGAYKNGAYEPLTLQQKQSIIKLAKYLKEKFHISKNKNYYHGQITHRKNPNEGKQIISLLNSINY